MKGILQSLNIFRSEHLWNQARCMDEMVASIETQLRDIEASQVLLEGMLDSLWEEMAPEQAFPERITLLASPGKPATPRAA